jgi:toxin YoeB
VDVRFTPVGWSEFQELLRADKKLFARTLSLIDACCREPFAGVGKPEPLKHQLAGCWSRRISERHRLVYCVDDGMLIVLSCIYHYGD